MKAGINTNYWDPFYKNKKTFLEKKAKPIMGLVPLSIIRTQLLSVHVLTAELTPGCYLAVTAYVQGNAIGKMCTPLSYQILLMPGAQPMLVCKECIGCALGY